MLPRCDSVWPEGRGIRCARRVGHDGQHWNTRESRQWDDESVERIHEAELQANFATFGVEVDAIDVPAIVRAGYEVWSYGYGTGDDDFTTIEESDLDNLDIKSGDELPDDWAPYRVAITDLTSFDPDRWGPDAFVKEE